jgi:[acyl-carrier-protein] S-malonyltransferase
MGGVGSPPDNSKVMAEELKEPGYAAAAQAEVPEVTPGKAPQPPAHAHAPRHRMSTVQEPATGAPRLPGLRDVSRQGSDLAAHARPRGLATGTAPLTAFIAYEDTVREDRVFVFPGQGAQSVGMGKDLYEQFSSARELYDRADDILGFSLSRLCFEGPEDELLKTRNAQPAIAVTSLALLKVATEVTPELLHRPRFVAGHSLGEYSALVAAGALPFDDAVRLLRVRGELMQAAGEQNPGTMAAVLGLDVGDCEEICREAGAEVCNVNAPGQVVIGGRRSAVVQAMDYAQARGAAKVIPLTVSGAFHSSLMRPAGDGMVQPIATAAITDPAIPVIANVTATPIDDANAIRHELVDQVCRPVQWSRTIEFLGDQGVTTFIEFGPGRVLTAIIKRMLRKATCVNVNDAASVRVEL